MTQKANIHKKEETLDNPNLLAQLRNAVGELEEKMKARIPISRGGARVGFGVDKAQRVIAADAIISIAKAIRSLKGW